MLHVWTELQFAAGFTFNTHRELSEWDIHTIRLASLYSHFTSGLLQVQTLCSCFLLNSKCKIVAK